MQNIIVIATVVEAYVLGSTIQIAIASIRAQKDACRQWFVTLKG